MDYPFYGVVFVFAVALGFSSSLALHFRGLMTGFALREARDFRWVVFLKETAEPSTVEERVLTFSGARGARFVTKEEALGRAQTMPTVVSGLKLTSRNPLPASFEVAWDPTSLQPERLAQVAEETRKMEGVLSVRYDASRLERLALLFRLVLQMDVVGIVLFWTGLAGAVVLAFCLLLKRDHKRWRSPLAGLLVGAVGGGVSVGVVFQWMGVHPWGGVLAGGLLGVLAGLGRAVSRP